MPYDERWLRRYGVVMEFVETNLGNPSLDRAEEQNYYNFVKRCGNVAECG